MNSIYLHWKKAILPTLFFLLISAIGMTKALAQEFTLGDLNYSINDELSVTVTGHVNGPNVLIFSTAQPQMYSPFSRTNCASANSGRQALKPSRSSRSPRTREMSTWISVVS